MRITFVTPVTDMSGGARVIHIYAKAMKERGHEVTLVSRPQVASWKKRVRALVTGKGVPPRTASGPTFYDPSAYAYHLADPFRPIGPADVPDADIVVATWWETAEWIGKYPAAKGRPVHFVQHYEAFPGIPKERVDAVLRLPIPKITISTWLSNMLRDEFGAKRVALIPNAVDARQFDAPPRGRQPRPTIGLVYSAHPSKDCGTAFRAFEKVRARFPDAELVTFGKTAPALGLPIPRGARFTLLPPQDRLRDLYASTDVWLCSSTTEGFGLPVLEAMACRCPVVSTRVAGPVDFVTEGVEGFLVPIQDPDAMAEKIAAVLSLPEADWRRMSDAAHATATGYSWNDAADRFEAALKDAASG